MATTAPDGSIASPPTYDSLATALYPPTSPRPEEEDTLPEYAAPTNHFRRLKTLLLPLFLIPLSLLLLFTVIPASDMSSATTFLKSILLPAILALILYLILQFAIVPLYRRHRARYSQYAPVYTPALPSSLIASTSTLRSNLLSFLLPSRWAEWRHRRGNLIRVVSADDGDEELGEDLGFEVGGELDGEEERRRRRRDGLSLSIEARRMRGGRLASSSDRRLSRDLEEGFADSSGDEDEEHEMDNHIERR